MYQISKEGVLYENGRVAGLAIKIDSQKIREVLSKYPLFAETLRVVLKNQISETYQKSAYSRY